MSDQEAAAPEQEAPEQEAPQQEAPQQVAGDPVHEPLEGQLVESGEPAAEVDPDADAVDAEVVVSDLGDAATEPAVPAEPTADPADPADPVEPVVPAELVEPAPAAEAVPAPPAVTFSTTTHAPSFDYTDAGVPTLGYLQDKIERRYANALGATELGQQEEQARAAAKKVEDRAKAAADKLEEIRRSLHPEG